MLNNNFIKIGKGGKKVFVVSSIDQEFIKRIPIKGFELHSFSDTFSKSINNNIPKEITFCGSIATWKILNNKKHEKYRNLLRIIKKYLLEKKIDTLYSNCNVLNKDFLLFLKENNIKSILLSADDPEGSKYYSKPACKYFDKVICFGVYHDKNRTIKEMFYSWKAKEVLFMPLFPHYDHYDYTSINYDKKDVDIIYIGALTFKKWKRLHLLHKKFQNKFHLYSHYDPRKSKSIIISTLYKLLNLFYPLPNDIKKLNDQEVKEIYKRSKIGYNEHLSFGPSNSRTYELPLNGVLEITDNEKGHKDLFDVRKDIICYRNKDIQEAIQKIEYYLKNYEERIQIAKSGYKKAINNFTFEILQEKFWDYILY